MKIKIRKILKVSGILFILTFLFLIYTNFSIKSYSTNKIYSQTSAIPETYSALVLGAGIKPDGTPSDMLYDRVLTAVDLYKSGKVKKLIMSGDNRKKTYDEPSVMINLAKKLGVKNKDLVPDYAGRRTYDSCYRAKNIFSQENLIIITQEFHLPRSIYLCEKLGIRSIGLTADRRKYLSSYMDYIEFREFLALYKSYIDVNILKPKVVGGEKINI